VSIDQQRLSAIIAAVINVNTELRELERLREKSAAIGPKITAKVPVEETANIE
jgi:hypothetical protein